MVALSEVLQSNSLIPSQLPPALTAAFFGGTTGIGAATAQKLASYVQQPTIYIVGRSSSPAASVIAGCRAVNPRGTYEFLQVDLSLLKNVRDVCRELLGKVEHINILFLSFGHPDLTWTETSERLLLLLSTALYARTLTSYLLAPALHRAPGLKRIVNVAGGALEGELFSPDIPIHQLSFIKMRPHLATFITLSLECTASDTHIQAIHCYPGIVRTPNQDKLTGIVGTLIRTVIWLLGRWICVPLDECAERHVFMATSATFGEGGVKVEGQDDGTEIREREATEVGGCVYSVGWDQEELGKAQRKWLEKHRSNGGREKVREHLDSEFTRILGRAWGE